MLIGFQYHSDWSEQMQIQPIEERTEATLLEQLNAL